MELRCPQCDSTDLKKVSLAYEEGLYQGESRTRLSAALAGSGGPDLIVGKAPARTSHQSALSKRLKPPAKWSYLKVAFWWVLMVLCLGWIIFYVNVITTNAAIASSTILIVFSLVSIAALVLLLVSVWRHNQSTSREYEEWNRSFVCVRCGTVSRYDLPRMEAA